MDEALKQKFYEGKTRDQVIEMFNDMFYGRLSRRILRAFQEKGEASLMKGLIRFGEERGRDLAAEYERLGIEKRLGNLPEYPDFLVRGKREWTVNPDGSATLSVTGSVRIKEMRRYGTEAGVKLYIENVFPALIRAMDCDCIIVDHGAVYLPKQDGGSLTFRRKDSQAINAKELEPDNVTDYLYNNKEYPATVKDLYDTMFGYIAQAVITELGDEGEQIVRRGIRDFGACRGNRLRELQLAEGLEQNLFNLMDYYDMPSVEGYHEEKEVFTPVLDYCNVIVCNHYERWKNKDLIRYGVMYCEEVHDAFWSAYCGDIYVIQPEILTRGDSRCRFETRIIKD